VSVRHCIQPMASCRCCGLCLGAMAVVPLAIVLQALVEVPIVTPFAWESVSATEEVKSKRTFKDNGAGVAFGSGEMFNKIAFAYDLGNRWMSFGLDQFWRQTLINDCLKLRADDQILDLATGTADVALLVGARLQELAAAAKGGPAVFGVDPSTEMLRIGVQKIRDVSLENVIHLHQGDAQNLSSVASVMGEPTVLGGLEGLATGSIDKISMSFGIRNVPDRSKALREMVRVLKKTESSRVCILEFSLPDGSTTLSKIAQFFITQIIPFIGSVATLGKGGAEYQYLERSIVEFPSPKEFAAQMTRNGLPVRNITSFQHGSVQLYTATVKVDA